ncbi:uncharacterized protein DNG_01021 [Cephalotrichum gorgonifer]|uniref:C2H2-type domain-containing protein n=1 Tax=Cephalotrichum gorgonifer TaxID=2041049 RepID=A0AAE8MQ95_9PEZI|nr:uncharacterized protein DNG_01021 [Cephalotrichum gorgonifer]
MSAVYEARAFLHEAPYPPMTDVDHDRTDVTERFGETDVSELANYNAQPSLLADERGPFDDAEDHPMVSSDAVDRAFDAARLLPAPTDHLILPELSAHTEPTPTPTPTTTAAEVVESASPGSKTNRSASNRAQLIPKPDRTVSKHTDGKYYCAWEGCVETPDGFKRRCEWSKHMDKHERPYRCEHDGCEKLSGFTYSGGLLRHEREVHGKHGGPKKTLNCPHQSCKRYTGKGFSRQENLNEHLRRVHTEGRTSPPGDDGHDFTATTTTGVVSDNDSERGQKRKRDSLEGGDEEIDVVEEVKRLRQENEPLREAMLALRQENEALREALRQHRETQITMVAQIADLQGALRLHDATLGAQLV